MSFAPLPDFFRALLIVTSCIAGMIDLLSRRIPNWLTLSALAAGIASRGFDQGMGGLATAAKGLGLALAVYIPLWLLRAIGAGDVKLMAALGAIAGPGPWLLIFVASSITGGIVGLVMAARRGLLTRTFNNTATIAAELLRFRTPWRDRPELDVGHKDALRMPHGAIIAAGVLLVAAAKLI